MRILMLNWRCPSNPKSGGAEYVTRKHLEAWAIAGHEVHWLAGGAKGLVRYEQLEVSDITSRQCASIMLSQPKQPEERPVIHIHRYGTPITIYLLAPLLYWFKWKGQFDLVIDQIHGIPFLTPLWAWNSRKIVFIHEVAQEIWDEMFTWPVNIIGKLYERLYLLLYRHILFWVDSNSTRDDLIRYGIQSSLIHVIPCAIDLVSVTEVREKEKSLTFIFLARLVKMKGIEDTLRIIAEVKKSEPKVKLWVVGGGKPSYVSHLQDMTKELDIEVNVEFKGRISEEEKVRLLRRAHWLLHTSMREGFGLTVLEANSQGTPVIAYDVPGLRDVVRHGLNGYLTEASRPMNLSSVISSISRNSYTSLCIGSITGSSQYRWGVILPLSTEMISKI